MKTLMTSCLDCGGSISFSDSETGGWKDCPDCGHRTLLSPLNAVATKESRRDYLRLIRSHTCYPSLRGLIDFLTGLGTIAAVLTLAVGIEVLYDAKWDATWLGNLEIRTGAITIAAAAAIVIIVLALRELCLLLIDLADATIEANSRRDRSPES